MGNEISGSGSRSWVDAFRRLEHNVYCVSHRLFIPRLSTCIGRALIRALRGVIFCPEYNREVLMADARFHSDLVFVYKGQLVKPRTLEELKRRGRKVVLFYPDVSFFTHGKYIPKGIAHYDHVYTTKTFGLDDLRKRLGYENASVVAHSAHPDIHRPVRISQEMMGDFGCDASFIGTWSPKKERYLAGLAQEVPGLKLKIWGSQWEKAREGVLVRAIQNSELTGDMYSAGITCSKINIALLSEARLGASSGDHVTARTFEIPCAGGFMLHERTDEALSYFSEGIEMACFGEPEELADKVRHYLVNDFDRTRIAEAGRKRALAEHLTDHRAEAVLRHVLSMGLNEDIG